MAAWRDSQTWCPRPRPLSADVKVRLVIGAFGFLALAIWTGRVILG